MYNTAFLPLRSNRDVCVGAEGMQLYEYRYRENTLAPAESAGYALSVIFTQQTHTLTHSEINGKTTWCSGFMSRPDDVRLHQAIQRLKSNSRCTLI